MIGEPWDSGRQFGGPALPSATWGARWGGWGAGVPCPHLEMLFVGLVVVQLRPEPQLRIIRFRSNEVDRKFPGSPETRSVWYGIAHRRAIGKILRLLYGTELDAQPRHLQGAQASQLQIQTPVA
jgi:hypothetical protein